MAGLAGLVAAYPPSVVAMIVSSHVLLVFEYCPVTEIVLIPDISVEQHPVKVNARTR